MTGEVIVGTVVGVLCCWGSAATFSGIALWARHSKTPVSFWAGTKIEPQNVSDIEACNQENSRMWTLYSIPFWFAGLFSLFFGAAHWCTIASLILLVLAGFPGLWLLFRRYKQIAAKYISREHLTN